MLRFLDYSELAEKYESQSPWNSPHNSKIAKELEHGFFCPSEDRRPNTSYFAIVGDGTIWRMNTGVAEGEVKDGLSKTILLIEVQGPSVHWMEPRDLSIDELVALIKKNKRFRSAHGDTVNVAFGDGNVKTIHVEQLTPDVLRALCTIDGGDLVPANFFLDD